MRQLLLRAEPDAVARILERCYRHRIAPELIRVAVPTLLVPGGRGTIVLPAVAQPVVAAILDAELVVMAEAGRVPATARPREVIRLSRE